MVHQLYWIIPLCLFLGLFFHRQIGWICIGILILAWWCSKRIGKIIASPFVLAWRIISFPAWLIWVKFDGYDGIYYSIRTAWRRDKSVYFARMFLTCLVQIYYFKLGIYLFHILLHK